MAEQRAACLGRERRPLAAVLAQERRDQEPEVLSPFPQGRQAEGEAGDARVQVGAEALRRHGILQVLVGGRDHAQVDSRRLARTHRQDFAFLHRAKQRGLGGQRQIADLVQEQRAAIRRAYQPGPALHRPGECPPAVAEQLALHQGGSDGRAVDGDESAPPAGELVERPGHDLFPSAGLTADHDGKQGAGHRRKVFQLRGQLGRQRGERGVGSRGQGGLRNRRAEHEMRQPDLQRVEVRDLALAHGLAVDEGAVRAPAVLHPEARSFAEQPGMHGGHPSVGQADAQHPALARRTVPAAEEHLVDARERVARERPGGIGAVEHLE